MGFPTDPDFEAVASSITVIQPKNLTEFEWEEILLERVPEDLQDPDRVGSFTIWFKSTSSNSLETVLEALQKELTAIGHKSNREIAALFLVIASFRRTQTESLVTTLNRFLGLRVKAKAFQLFIFPPSPHRTITCPLGQFYFQTFDEETVFTFLKKTKTTANDDFFSQFLGRQTIERQPSAVVAINWLNEEDGTLSEIWENQKRKLRYNRFLNKFFDSVAKALRVDFWLALLDEQDLYVAADALYFPEQLISEMVASHFVTIIYEIGPETTGNSSCQEITASPPNLVGFEAVLMTLQQTLYNDFGFKSFTNVNVHNTLKTYTKFVSRGIRHVFDGRVDEGFLHFVIALDLLFADKNSKTKTIAKRAACVTHHALGRPFQEVRELLIKFYDLRSRYVHDGQQIPEDEIEIAREICREVLFALLRFQKSQIELDGFGNWIRRLDECVNVIECGHPPNQLEMEALGISIINAKRDIG